MSSSSYQPGVCNIGPAEIRRRWTAGWTGTALTIVALLAMIAFHAAPRWRFLLFFPSTLASFGFIQAATHFCAAYGFAGLFNVVGQAGKTDSVADAAFRRQDRRKAAVILGAGVVIGATIATLAYFLL